MPMKKLKPLLAINVDNTNECIQKELNHYKLNIQNFNFNENHAKFIHLCVFSFAHILSCIKNMSNTQINVLMDEVHIYENKTLHHPIYLCVKHVFNTQSPLCKMFELMNEQISNNIHY